MSIWFKDYNLEDANAMFKGSMMETLDIKLTEKGDDFLCGTMPIDHRTVHPLKVLHGGASVVLAESIGSLASFMSIDTEKQHCVGQSITANHIRPGFSGLAHGKATLVHMGKLSHIWNIDITNDEGKLLCVCRLTMAIINK